MAPFSLSSAITEDSEEDPVPAIEEWGEKMRLFVVWSLKFKGNWRLEHDKLSNGLKDLWVLIDGRVIEDDESPQERSVAEKLIVYTLSMTII